MTEKYTTGKIYKLVTAGHLECYIGSTCSNLKQRLWHHTHAFNTTKQTQSTSHKLYELNKEVSIQLVEDFPCNSKAELLIRERYWIENTLNCINNNIPTQTWQERRVKNKDHDLELRKIWLEANKERIAKENATPEKRAHKYALHRKIMEDPDVRAAFNAKRNELLNCPTCDIQIKKRYLTDHVKIHGNFIAEKYNLSV